MSQTQRKPSFALSHSVLVWLLVSLGCVMLPHVLRLPLWAPLLFAILAGWRYGHQRRAWPLPSAGIRILIALALVAGIVGTFHSLFGRDAGVTFLVGLMGLKLLEMNSQRDALLLLFLGYFLILTNFLYSQSPLLAAYLFLAMLLISATLISLSDVCQRLSWIARLRLSAALVAQGIPLMVVLFLFFPRIEGPMWGLPEDAYAGRSGLSDSMTLGNISQLSLSDEVVFRVMFEGEVPAQSDLYWRGPVLWWTDGRTWKNLFQSLQTNVSPLFFGDPVRYTVTLEAHNKPWLFALELPEAPPSNILSYQTVDYQLHARFPVSQLTRYTLVSYSDYHALSLNEQQRSMALRLPKGAHPQARALAATWREKMGEDEQKIVQQALYYFRHEPFVYTLQPPPMLKDTVDEFLFQTRRGFCEHYASAFTVLMRSAGIPARVVTGYQGGEINPLGNYLVVRQRDAHAWSEVWLENQGWVRVDPTAAVSPTRIESGIDTALPPRFSTLGFEFSQDSALARWTRHWRNGWDALNNGWNQWVLGYGPQRQMQLMRSLGIADPDYHHLALAMLSTLSALLLGIGLWLLRGRYLGVRDPLLRQYQYLCNKLARRGLARHTGEGPLTYAQRVSTARPDLSDQIRSIVHFYLRLRYRQNASILQIKRLAAQVRRFRP